MKIPVVEAEAGFESALLIILPIIDQARPEANSCRSTNSIQGYRCYWRL